MRCPSSKRLLYLLILVALTHHLMFLAYCWIVLLLIILFVLCFPPGVNVYYLFLSVVVHFIRHEDYKSSNSGARLPGSESQLCHSLSDLEQVT